MTIKTKNMYGVLLLVLANISAFSQTVNHWKIDNLTSIGGHKVTVYGDPKVAIFDGESESFSAVEFDGIDDGIIIDGNPLVGASEFTAEVIFWPDDNVPQEPRFVHFQQDDNNRVLIELRNFTQGEWYVDTFIKSGGTSNDPLIDEAKTHPTQQWQHAALIFSQGKMKHYINGVMELEGPAVYTPMSSGQLSLGMRMNIRNFLKGKIKEVRVTHKALDPSEFLTATGKSNIAPIVANPLEDLEKESGFGSAEIDLAQVFSDADNDAITYVVASSDESIAKVSVVGSTLTISESQPAKYGTTTITVTANDGNAGQVSDDFELTIPSPPLSGSSYLMKQLDIFPNPTSGIVSLKLHASAATVINVRVRNMSGQDLIIRDYDNLGIGDHALSLDLHDLSKGIYFIMIQQGEMVDSLKVILE